MRPRLLSARCVGLAALLAVGLPGEMAARANGAGPVLHEKISSDPAEDARLGVAIDGDLPAALSTPSGVISAPDPHRLPSPAAPPSADSAVTNAAPNARFHPDRDTHRPDVVPYDDPFTPSTAPFKRLLAFDSVEANYALSVHDGRLLPLAQRGQPASDGSDDSFFADLVVDLVPDKPQRIPSVGPGAKIVRARAGVGSADVSVRFLHDAADNWFVVGDVSTRARLVMELAIPRATFGGGFADPGWSDLPKVPALPTNVARAAAEVAAHIGVSRGHSPRDVVSKLVAYFRSFVDSDEFPTANDDVYLALALSKKGVCRHRAFAFLVTALGLGLPTRMIANEAHAWVEVNDGSLWRRIDLGGAGRAMDAALAGGVKHDAPPDPFAWPPNASRGDELAERARSATTSPGGAGDGTPNGGAGAKSPTATASAGSESHSPSNGPLDDRPESHVSLSLDESSSRRGSPLHVHGDVAAEGSACGHLIVELGLRDGRGLDVELGALSTDDSGKYDGALMVPTTVPLGDYDLYVRTDGDTRCGRGSGP
jgi:hypothetical protein